MPRIEGPSMGEGVQAVGLALRILEYLADQGSVGVTALAQALGTSKSRIHRHLRTLMELGYVVQSPESEKYRVGARLVTLGRRVAEHFDMAALARGIMRDLRDTLGHSVVLSQVDPEGARVLATVFGSSDIEIGVRSGSLLKAHCTAQGKVVLAFSDAARQEAVLRAPMERRTPYTISDPGALEAEFRRIRAQGWGGSPNETLLGTNAIAAPVFGVGGELLGALAIIDSIQFVPEQPSKRQVDAVMDAARRLSAAIGYAGDAVPHPEPVA
ncbi:IclR family transcriptional regulator [Muricoccus radiodurans]|uniref:IclR family transcriptional regulator n=1 Tax=Muricoccus radiodurans TaxID=2231721 RepID=UPI003CF9CEF8